MMSKGCVSPSSSKWRSGPMDTSARSTSRAMSSERRHGNPLSERPPAVAPRSRSARHVASLPAKAATTSGVWSSALMASISAPASRSASQHAVCPARAARCKGVSSQTSLSSALAPSSKSRRAASAAPPFAAAWSAVQPQASSRVMDHEGAARSCAHGASSPLRAVSMKSSQPATGQAEPAGAPAGGARRPCLVWPQRRAPSKTTAAMSNWRTTATALANTGDSASASTIPLEESQASSKGTVTSFWILASISASTAGALQYSGDMGLVSGISMYSSPEASLLECDCR
mmetsp:Transcript_79958/g.224428  ORF Transcript_79958/g.224428 Transcript_79958/m.224428 type:complete len:288 (+) Transcript_79958:205-1068(+)